MRRKTERLKSRHDGGNGPHNDGVSASLRENINTQPSQLWHAVGNVARSTFFQFLHGKLVRSNQLSRNPGCVHGSEDFNAWDVYGNQFAIQLHERGPTW